jgi:hypothetical protein
LVNHIIVSSHGLCIGELYTLTSHFRLKYVLVRKYFNIVEIPKYEKGNVKAICMTCQNDKTLLEAIKVHFKFPSSHTGNSF